MILLQRYAERRFIIQERGFKAADFNLFRLLAFLGRVSELDGGSEKRRSVSCSLQESESTSESRTTTSQQEPLLKIGHALLCIWWRKCHHFIFHISYFILLLSFNQGLCPYRVSRKSYRRRLRNLARLCRVVNLVYILFISFNDHNHNHKAHGQVRQAVPQKQGRRILHCHTSTLQTFL